MYQSMIHIFLIIQSFLYPDLQLFSIFKKFLWKFIIGYMSVFSLFLIGKYLWPHIYEVLFILFSYFKIESLHCINCKYFSLIKNPIAWKHSFRRIVVVSLKTIREKKFENFWKCFWHNYFLQKQSTVWSSTTPTAWRYAYIIVVPTKLIQRFLRSFEIVSESSVCAETSERFLGVFTICLWFTNHHR